MADYLENMAMELKCPVCLSLLDSSVSLVCNHIFCNSCILSSMKTTSSCPVCKVPFRRREVRPAPHMDNLVNIYKNMKSAAGVNSHSTQTTPSTKNSEDGDVNVEDEKTRVLQYKKTRRGKLKRKSVGNSKRKKPNECNVQVSDSQTSTGPSFPMNKRVRVTPYSLPETPVRPEKIPKIGEENIDNGIANASDANLQDENNGSAAANETVSLKDNCGPMFSPFFSLREDYNGEEDPMQPSSQQTADNDMPEIAAPCFSDMKDSDSGTPEKMTQTSLGQVSDSEVFETRISCSPDLCITPVKQRVPSNYINSEKENQDISMKKSTFSSSSSQNNKTYEECEAWVGKNNKRSRTRRSRSSGKCSRMSIDDITAVNEENLPNSCEDMIKSNKGKQSAEKSMTASSCLHDVDFAVMEYADKGRKKHLKTKNADQKTQANKSYSRRRSKHLDGGLVSCKGTEKPEALFSRENNPKVGICTFTPENKITGQTMQQRSTMIDDYTKATEDSNETCLVNKPSTENAEGEITMDCQQKPLEINTVENHHWLKKCSKSSSQIKCVFCKSSEQTEISGEMMHYFKCKPVASDYNGGNNILHAHRYCTEWAPNVYFDEEIAVNLTDEVARSRRISCSCCGMKGAALGCFEKSCRKSFHFTCAKLVPECKWDNENFVMLCPLHSTSKLPFEVSHLEKKKTNLKRESQGLAGGKDDVGTSSVWKWPHGSPYKWVLCCSALNGSDKDIVAEFTNLSGIPVSKTWTPNVTHVIASTDDKGACKRTLKVLMGIIEGKWILNIDWLKACLDNMEPVDEEKFEVSIDNHGIKDGPRLGRLRVSKEKPKLFRGFNFYFMGDFTPSYKGYLQDLVTASGGTVLQRKPIPKGDMLDVPEETYIIYSREVPENQKSKQDDTEIFMRRQKEAEVLADNCGAKLVANTWLLNSIAASTLQSIEMKTKMLEHAWK